MTKAKNVTKIQVESGEYIIVAELNKFWHFNNCGEVPSTIADKVVDRIHANGDEINTDHWTRLTFERCTCSRCGGTGKYSWCQQWQDRCFKCNGKGEMLTKVGIFQEKFYKHINSIELIELEDGMTVEFEGRGKYIDLRNVVHNEDGSVTFQSRNWGGTSTAQPHWGKCYIKHSAISKIAPLWKVFNLKDQILKSGKGFKKSSPLSNIEL